MGGVFKLQRFFSLASLALIVVAAVLLGLLYRTAALDNLTTATRQSNAVLARSLVNLMAPDLHALARHGHTPDPATLLSDPHFHALRGMVKQTIRDLPVTAIEVINADGHILFSLDDALLSLPISRVPGWTALIARTRAGLVSHRLRPVLPAGQSRAAPIDLDPDTAAPRDSEDITAEHVMETAILLPWAIPAGVARTATRSGTGTRGEEDPPSLAPGAAPLPVFLLSTDLSAGMHTVRTHQVWAMAAGAAVLGLLYLGQFLVVRHADRVLRRQQSRLRQETEARAVADARYRESDDLLRLITDNLPALVSYASVEEGETVSVGALRIRFANRAHGDWFGRPAHTLIDLSPAEVLGDRDYAVLAEAFRIALQGTPVVREVRLSSVNRSARVHIIPHRRDRERVIGCFLMITDISEHKHLETALRAAHDDMERQVAQRTRELEHSEQRMSDVAQASSDWFWETGPDHRFIWFSVRDDLANPKFDPNLAYGQRRVDLIATDLETPDKIARHMDDLENHRPFRDFTYWSYRTFISSRGEGSEPLARLVRTSGVPLFDEDGTFVGYRGSATDITQQVEAEARATRAEARLKAALEGLSDGFALWDENDRLILWNQALGRLIPGLVPMLKEGTTFEDLARGNLSDREAEIIVSGEHGTEVCRGQVLPMRLEQHRNPRGTVEIHDPGGLWVLITERKTPDGQTLTIYTDITRRKLIELELADSEAALRAFHGITNDTERSLDDRLAALLAFGCDQFGLDTGVALERQGDILAVLAAHGPGMPPKGAPFASLSHTYCSVVMDSRSPVAIADVHGDPLWQDDGCAPTKTVGCYLGAPLLRGTEVIGTLCFSAADARSKPFRKSHQQLLALAAQWLSGELSRQHTEQALRAAMEQADLANRSKSEFLANMSHELRTPLNAILGFSEMMRGQMVGPLGDPRYVDYARGIHDSGSHLLAIINDILDVSKIEAGQMDLSEEETPLGSLIVSASRLVASRAMDSNVSLDITPRYGMPVLRVDMRRIKQVLLNLLTNAVKFTPQGGSVTVSVVCPDAQQGVTIAIRDTGIGMSPGEIAVALAPFGQIDSGLARRHEGTGLGLPLTQALIELHGGRLTLSSQPGNGTTATITLPRERVVRYGGAGESPSDPGSGSPSDAVNA